MPSSYKARWVAKGYSQREGIDFNELYAAVTHKDTIRVFLSLANHLDLECNQADIKAAFLSRSYVDQQGTRGVRLLRAARIV
jgi:hypothetical protein